MFVLDLLPGGILCYFWLIHFESGTVKILFEGQHYAFVVFHWSIACSLLVLFEEIKNWKTSRTILLLQNFPCQLRPAGNFHFLIYFYLLPSRCRDYGTIFFYILLYCRKELLSCQVRHTLLAETVTPTFSQQLSVHHAVASNLHRANTSFVMSVFIYQNPQSSAGKS